VGNFHVSGIPETSKGFLEVADDSPRLRVPMRQTKTFGDLTEGRSVESCANLERIVFKKKKDKVVLNSEKKRGHKNMQIEREQEVRELAYGIWQQQGCLHGYDVQHWVSAEAIWLEKHRPKRKPKKSNPVKKGKSRKISTAEREP
jgi:hypothetical protein